MWLRWSNVTLVPFQMIGTCINAGIYLTQKLWKGPVEELAPEEWDRVMEVNLKGVFLGSNAAIPIMKRQRQGKIIDIASGTFFCGSGNMPHCTTAKGGGGALTRVMARQLGEFGTNVNCMTPGSTMSEESVSDEVLKRREGSVNKRAFRFSPLFSVTFSRCVDERI